MGTIENLRRAVSHPKLFARKINQIYHTRLGTLETPTDSIDFFSSDWDNLLLLDACRYDAFRDHASTELPGELSLKRSNASATAEWVNNNFTGRDLRDVVYVTSNPAYADSRSLDCEMFNHIPTWDEDGRGRDSMRPETVANLAKEANREYPNKRLLIHFLQPHCPFLGQRGSEKFTRCPWEGHVLLDEYRYEGVYNDINEAYIENLKLTIPVLQDLIPELTGKTVVTADHGQLLGERQFPIPIREVAHPGSYYVDELLEIPWLVIEGDTRKEVRKDPPVEKSDGRNVDVVEDRLDALGYVS